MAQPLEALRRLCRSLQSAEAVGEQALMQSENCQTLVCLLNLVGTFLEALSASATQSPSLSTSLRGQSLSQQLQALEASVREATALLRRCTLAKSRVYLALRDKLLVDRFTGVATRIGEHVMGITSLLPVSTPHLASLRHKAGQVVGWVGGASFIEDTKARRVGEDMEMLLQEERQGMPTSSGMLQLLATRLRLRSASDFAEELLALGALVAATGMEGQAEEEEYLGEALSLLRQMEAATQGDEEEEEGRVGETPRAVQSTRARLAKAPVQQAEEEEAREAEAEGEAEAEAGVEEQFSGGFSRDGQATSLQSTGRSTSLRATTSTATSGSGIPSSDTSGTASANRESKIPSSYNSNTGGNQTQRTPRASTFNPRNTANLILERAANNNRESVRTPRHAAGAGIERLSTVGDHSFARATPRFSASGLGDDSSSAASQGHSAGAASAQRSGITSRDSGLLHATPRYSAAAGKHSYASVRSVTINSSGSMTPRPVSARASLQQAAGGAGTFRERRFFGAPSAVHPEPEHSDLTQSSASASNSQGMAQEAKAQEGAPSSKVSFSFDSQDVAGPRKAEPLSYKTRGGASFSTAVGRSITGESRVALPGLASSGTLDGEEAHVGAGFASRRLSRAVTANHFTARQQALEKLIGSFREAAELGTSPPTPPSMEPDVPSEPSLSSGAGAPKAERTEVAPAVSARSDDAPEEKMVLSYDDAVPARESKFLRHAATFNRIPEDPQPAEAEAEAEAEGATDVLGRRSTLTRSTSFGAAKHPEELLPPLPLPPARVASLHYRPKTAPAPRGMLHKGLLFAKPVFGLASKVTAAGSAALKKASHALAKPRVPGVSTLNEAEDSADTQERTVGAEPGARTGTEAEGMPEDGGAKQETEGGVAAESMGQTTTEAARREGLLEQEREGEAEEGEAEAEDESAPESGPEASSGEGASAGTGAKGGRDRWSGSKSGSGSQTKGDRDRWSAGVDFAAAATHAFTRVSSMPGGTSWWGPLAAAKGQVGKSKGQGAQAASTAMALAFAVAARMQATDILTKGATHKALPAPPAASGSPLGLPGYTGGSPSNADEEAEEFESCPLSRRSSTESASEGLPLMDTQEQGEILELVSLLTQPSDMGKRTAARHIRELTKQSPANRSKLGAMGAIPPLVNILQASMSSLHAAVGAATVEAAVYALLNLSIDDNNKMEIADCHGLEALFHVLRTGNPSAREGAVAVLFSLSAVDDHKIAIGQSAAIPLFLDTLVNGTPSGQHDAVLLLFNLSLASANKAALIQEGVVRPLVHLIETDPTHTMADTAVGIILSLSSRQEGREALIACRGVQALAEMVRCGSKHGQEDAAATLLALIYRERKNIPLVMQENLSAHLTRLMQSGSPRARDKARAIFKILYGASLSKQSETEATNLALSLFTQGKFAAQLLKIAQLGTAKAKDNAKGLLKVVRHEGGQLPRPLAAGVQKSVTASLTKMAHPGAASKKMATRRPQDSRFMCTVAQTPSMGMRI